MKTGPAGLIVLIPLFLLDAVERGLLVGCRAERPFNLDLRGFQVDAASQVDQFVTLPFVLLLIVILGCLLSCGIETSLRDIDVVDLGVVKSLVGVLVLEAEPRLVVGTLLDLFIASVEGPDGQEEHMPLALKVFQLELDLPVVIYLQLLISEVVQESQTT